MAQDATEHRSILGFLTPSAFLLRHFNRKTQFISYLLLCVAKMPFVPPVSITRSRSAPVSGGLTGKVRPVMSYNASATVPLARTKAPAEAKGSSVAERLASNLKHLGKKSQPRSRLPTAKAMSGSGLNSKCKGHWLSSPKRLSGESIPKTPQCSPGSLNSALVKGGPHEVKVKARHREKEEEGARFTLTLTPEAVLLLQRRSNERQRCVAARSAIAGGAEVAGGNADHARRRRESGSNKRHQPAARHTGTLGSRAALRNGHDSSDVLVAPGDVSSLVKISLLNERHKYDDVEYEEEEEDCGVDERVVLKCTEWLRGLENAPVTVGSTSFQNVGTSLKSF